MDPYKGVKLNHAIQRALAELLQQGVKDPRLSLVTIAGVEVNRDRSVARVYWSVTGSEEDTVHCERGLRRAARFLQGRLGDMLRLRESPQLRFVRDDSLDRGFGIDAVLKELEAHGEFEDEKTRRRRLALADLRPPADLLEALRRGRRFWLAPHENPDPDAVGAALALAGALRAMDREAIVFAYPDPPAGFAALPGFPGLTTPAAEAEARWAAGQTPDALIMIDCHRRERAPTDLAGVLDRVQQAWCVDHHLVSGRRQPLPGWIEPVAESSSTLVFRVIEELSRGCDGEPPFEIDLDMATNVFAGIVNDSGGFRFPSTLPLTFELAHRLAALGVETAAVTEITLHRRSRAATALLQRVLAGYRYHGDGRVLTLRADRTMLAETGATLADTEGMLGLATAVAGVRYVAFLKQLGPQQWRVSLRSPGGGDVEAVAARFGGGGHRAAAGCTLVGDADEIERRVVDALLEQG